MKPDEIEAPPVPDDWLEFYMWALSVADAESEGTPETRLIADDGEPISTMA